MNLFYTNDIQQHKGQDSNGRNTYLQISMQWVVGGGVKSKGIVASW